jgi:hypothetical protein
MELETYSGDNFSPGLLPGEQSDGMDEEEDFEAGRQISSTTSFYDDCDFRCSDCTAVTYTKKPNQNKT